LGIKDYFNYIKKYKKNIHPEQNKLVHISASTHFLKRASFKAKTNGKVQATSKATSKKNKKK
jgi:uncharacterized short protein YbdD (DUF466 family)